MSPRGSRRRWAAGLLALWLLAAGADDFPALTGRLVDTAGALAPDRAAALESRLAALEADTGAQLAVLLVPSTAPLTIEQYAVAVAERWALGRERVDDGALLLIALEDRRLRIEVGYGLEGAIPDALAKRIIEEQITPQLRAGDLPAALTAGIEALGALIRGESLPAPQDRPQGEFIPAMATTVIATIWAGALVQPFLGVALGALAWGALVGIVAFAFLGSLPAALALAVLGALLCLVMERAPRTWHSGGPRGGGFGRGGGSRGGGFRGGGGGFGGGGASGGW